MITANDGGNRHLTLLGDCSRVAKSLQSPKCIVHCGLNSYFRFNIRDQDRVLTTGADDPLAFAELATKMWPES